MARNSRTVQGHDLLEQHAQVIERLVPTARAVAFFDAQGKPLRCHGSVPLTQVRLQVRSVLKSTATEAGRRPIDALLPISATERAAALVLYAGEPFALKRMSRLVMGVCLIVFHASSGEECLPVEALKAQLSPALACVGDYLAKCSVTHTPEVPPEKETSDLEWLLEVTPVPLRNDSERPTARGERLVKLVVTSVERLQCALGAVVVPDRHLRIVRIGKGSDDLEDALRHLESPILRWVRTKNRSMVVNKAMPRRNDAAAMNARVPVRVLAVPVDGHTRAPAGALILMRSVDVPEFTRHELSLARHMGRYVACLLETDYDVMTGLHTRWSAQREVASWKQAVPQPAGPYSVIFLGIDRLGIVNDTKGFDAGDALIVGVAQLLAGQLLPRGAVAARVRSVNFAIALPSMDTEAAAGLARTLQQAAGKLSPATASDDEQVTLSCGIASFAEPREFPSALALAQIAYRAARDHGKGGVEIYRDDDDSMIRRRSDSLAVIRLREALHNDRFSLVAQRIMPLHGRGDTGGFELLLRMPGEDHAPADLLAAAHRSSMAPVLDLWVVEHALADAAPYHSALRAANAWFAINITGSSLTDPTFLERVERLIRRSRIAPSLITFEITETVAVLNMSKAVKFIRELRAMGCRFALDDFGTGTNSLKNLTSLPVDHIKIDGSFVTDILGNPQSAAMVRAIVSLTRDLRIGTVAEYAENAKIVERLRELGVQYAQGYGVEKPRAFKDVLDELAARESQENRALGREI